MNTPVSINHELIDLTLRHLRDAGAKGSECVVLWLAERQPARNLVKQVYRPFQNATSDFFRIPSAGMEELMRVLDEQGLFVAAQVHSHPARAFHSKADDQWAIVRHRGALSLVVPWFGSRTSVDTFPDDAVTYCLDLANRWCEVPRDQLESLLELAR